uniref:CTD24 n=1 Tax=Heliconius melpomene TaxID=34740 RepID=A0A2H4RMT4_HELME|nr:CTD24 [Heliconius melpomene]
MESLPQNCILEFNPDTLTYLRIQYNLDSPGRIEEAISVLQEWIYKQPHFLKRDFPQDYLERTIIISKGSVEKAKKKLDRICTLRTIFPEFFGVHNVHEYELLNDLYGVFLPKITNDHYRVFFLKNKGKKYINGFADFYRYLFMQFEYIQAYDYCNGLTIVFDYTEANIMETLKWFSPVNLKDATTTIREGYGMRIKGLHLLSDSKAIEAIIALFKQVLSEKLIGRVHVHKTIESLYEYIPKDILPVEYGGKEKSLLQLHEECKNALTSNEFSDYLREMNKARTDEKLRQDDNHQYMGTQGTFRTLNVD